MECSPGVGAATRRYQCQRRRLFQPWTARSLQSRSICVLSGVWPGGQLWRGACRRDGRDVVRRERETWLAVSMKVGLIECTVNPLSW